MFARSRRNLAYLFASSMGSILLVFASAIYYLFVEEQLQVFDEQLYTTSKAIAHEAQYQLDGQKWQMEPRNVSLLDDAIPLLNNGLVYARWYNAHKELVQSVGISGSRRLTIAPGFQTRRLNKQWIREITLPVKQNNVVIGYLQTAHALTPLRDSLNRARLFLTLGVPTTLGLIGITGWFLGGLAIQPTRRAYEQLQRFTADASHELRAPVAAILSNAQVALMPPRDEAEQHFRLENIVEIGKSMSNLINHLLFLSRHEGALDPNTLKSLNLTELLRSLAEEYHQQAVTQNLHFDVCLPEQSVIIKADANLLKQAIFNLLSNAFKYTPKEGTVKLQLLLQSHRAIIQVEDNGIGIPESDLPHIFDRFYRVDTARSRQTGGFGLGLAIAHQIVQAHKGQIVAKSLLGQGSTFQIELPIHLG